MSNHKKTESGQSLLEALLALAVFAMAVVTIAHLFLGAHYSVAHSVEKSQAILLAKEGIEAVRSIRDNDFERIGTTTAAGIELVANRWQFRTNHSPDITDGRFERRINITSKGAGVWQVVSTVEWNSIIGRLVNVSFTEYLTAWRLPLHTAGLIGWWQFEEGTACLVSDGSGNNNHGTLRPDCPANSPVWIAGRVGNWALSFDGVDDFVSVSHSPSLDVASAITIGAWVNPTSTHRDGLGGIWHDMLTADRNRVLARNDGSLLAEYRIGGVDRFATTTAGSVPLNVFTHVALTYNGSEIVFWVNGIRQTPVTATGTIALSTSTKQIGWGHNVTHQFNGVIDDVRLYNRALSATEIRELSEMR